MEECGTVCIIATYDVASKNFVEEQSSISARSLVRHQNGKIRLRLILDRFSAELFVNDGEQVLSAIIYTDQTAEGSSFFSNGLVNMDVVKYDLM